MFYNWFGNYLNDITDIFMEFVLAVIILVNFMKGRGFQHPIQSLKVHDQRGCLNNCE